MKGRPVESSRVIAAGLIVHSLPAAVLCHSSLSHWNLNRNEQKLHPLQMASSMAVKLISPCFKMFKLFPFLDLHFIIGCRRAALQKYIFQKLTQAAREKYI